MSSTREKRIQALVDGLRPMKEVDGASIARALEYGRLGRFALEANVVDDLGRL